MLKKLVKKIPFTVKLYQLIRRYHKYIQYLFDFNQFSQLQKKNSRVRFTLDWRERYPCVDEKTTTTSFDAHYIYHPAWAARIIAEIKPSRHVDLSSTLHFCSIISAFLPVDFYDYRIAELTLDGLNCGHGDLMKLPFLDNSVESLSCMHVIEHVGLGRYGDPLDPDGDLKAIAELIRVLKKDGSLLFVTPVGKPKIYFNAHRVYSYEQIAEYFSGLTTMEFALIDDNGCFSIGADSVYANVQEYGCGCWWFRK